MGDRSRQMVSLWRCGPACEAWYAEEIMIRVVAVLAMLAVAMPAAPRSTGSRPKGQAMPERIRAERQLLC
jgi:hypothetical protein